MRPTLLTIPDPRMLGSQQGSTRESAEYARKLSQPILAEHP
jgi:hypothetical protein